MMRRHTWLISILSAIFSFLLIQTPVLAEGYIYYSGWFGADYGSCGSPSFPCGTYYYAYSQACNLSETYSDTYHVYHAYYGYAGSCDMVGGSGTETPSQSRKWEGFLSMLLPSLLVFILAYAGTLLYHRKVGSANRT